MNFEIKNRFSGNIIFSLECESLKFCTEAAIKSGADLHEADLSRANLRGADLCGANLREANLSKTNLRGACLCGADLSRANLSRANLSDANLSAADLREADLFGADMRGACLYRANLCEADLSRSDLFGADLRRSNVSRADLSDANLQGANLQGADLQGVDLRDADLSRADLSDANLRRACLRRANLYGANLCEADLSRSDLSGTKNMVKLVGVEPGNFYWKRFELGLNNNGYQFHVGLNTLRDGESFADDERVMCSFPGLHFASRSWCAAHYSDRPLEARIRIPEGAQINEPWATDGKASADTIEIIQVFDVKTGKDVTDEYRR